MKKLLLIILALLIIAAVAFGVRTLGARDETDAVSTKDAKELVQGSGGDKVDENGNSTETDDVELGLRPEPGTYGYTGSGSEKISALGGSTHEFPEKIAAVVDLNGTDTCNWTMNVVYVKQHIEERNYCTSDTLSLIHI